MLTNAMHSLRMSLILDGYFKSVRRNLGFSAASYELNDDPVVENILSGIGFAYGLSLTLRLFRKVSGQQFIKESDTSRVHLSRNMHETFLLV